MLFAIRGRLRNRLLQRSLKMVAHRGQRALDRRLPLIARISFQIILRSPRVYTVLDGVHEERIAFRNIITRLIMYVFSSLLFDEL